VQAIGMIGRCPPSIIRSNSQIHFKALRLGRMKYAPPRGRAPVCPAADDEFVRPAHIARSAHLSKEP
jgi:hypothetical protein